MTEDFSWKILYESSPIGINILDENFQLLNCNKASYNKIFGFSTKENYLAKSHLTLPKYQPNGTLTAKKVAEELKTAVEKGYHKCEWMVQDINEVLIPLDVTATYVKQNDKFIIILYMQDLRSLRKMNAKIRETEESNKLLLDASPFFMETWDENLQLINCNKRMLQPFGIASKEEFFARYNELLPPTQPCGTPSRQKLMSLVMDTFNNGYANHEFWHITSNGEPLPVESTFVRIKANNKSVVVCYSHDLRPIKAAQEIERKREGLESQRRIEAAEENNRAKSRFLANMSHEIRTPMNSVVGFSELALEHEMPSEVRKYLEKIVENSNWLLRIIDDILDISKIEAGKMKLEDVPFDIEEIFTSCQASMTPKALQKNLKLYFYTEPVAENRLLVGDPVRLRQIFLNIISNAIKFTNEGCIKVSSLIKDITPDSVTMYCEVKDTGIGMTKEQIDVIFEAFSQADSTITRRFGGTGLGLPIVSSLLDMMDSKVEVKSVFGEGTTVNFSITFKTTEVCDDCERPVDNTTSIERPNLTGEVLVCEDNEMNQIVISEYLDRVGLTYQIAENGKIGLDMIKERIANKEKPYDLIFMDIHMPVMDGLEAAEKISSLNIDTPVVAMTANVMTSDRELYRQLGMSDCVGKPFTSQELWACLLKYITG